jgi:hypothetical protein
MFWGLGVGTVGTGRTGGQTHWTLILLRTRVSREFQESFARVSREFHESFTGVSREIRGSFARDSPEFR